MPLLARLYVKTSLVYLAVAFLAWAFSAAPLADPVPFIAATRLAQTHLFVVGWLTQLIFGVAFWLFPRHSREAPYGEVWPAWTGYVLLNSGLLLRAVFEPVVHLEGWGRWGLGASGLLQWLGACCLAVYLWRRVKTR